MRSATANHPSFGVLLHSLVHSLRVASFERRMALDLVVPMGEVRARSVARFASRSARSLPGIPVCPGHHLMVNELDGAESRKLQSIWWKEWA